ncbi:MAG: FtsQ-type POTRA domain-containing protein [Eggerthellaceae bacterium]|nr:FtsQ-type POTRA domain-containing protein [Eggerthellaceae bacterium]
MASSSSRKFDSSGSNNPRKKRKSKKGAKTTRALGSARSSSSSIPLSTSADITPRTSRPLSGSDSNSKPVSRRRDSRPISRSTSRSTSRSIDVTPRRSQDIASSGSVGGSSSPSRLKSKTIAQVDKERRRSKRVDTAERAKKASRVPLIVIGSIVCVIIITVVALFLMSRTDALEIESVDIKGADHLTQQELNALASIPQGATLLNVDSDSIIKSLMRDSWVESVDVNRVFPSTLEIIIHEREVGAVVEVPSGNTQTIQNWLLSKDAVWLMALPNRESEVGSQISERIYEDAEAALHITNITYGVRPEMGSTCTDEPILNAISILTGLTTELADRIKTVKAEDVEATSLILDSNVEIAVGSANNIREKELICLDILEDNPKVVYINVRVPDRPTWKSA